MDSELAVAQAVKYAEELRVLYAQEREQRRSAERALVRLQESYAMTVRGLAAALELRDDATGAHAERVARIALSLARRIAPELAADPQLEYAFLLHDVGKIGIPDAILLKPKPLTEDERRTMEQHPLLGQRVLEHAPQLGQVVREVVAFHHERWDGTGYPLGIAGTHIPLAARIFAVVDAFDAMTSDRPYREALPVAAALDEIARGSGTDFDPAVVRAFLSMQGELENLAA